MGIVKLWLALLIMVSYSRAQWRRTLYENDLCKSGDNRWVCLRLSNCVTAQQAIRAGQWPETCTFHGTEPVVCCPPAQGSATNPSTSTQPAATSPQPTSQNLNSKAKQMCSKYSEYVFREEEPPILLAANVEEIKTVKFDECVRSGEPLVVGGTDAMPKEFPHMAQIGYGESPRISWLCGGSLISERFVLSAAHCTKPNNRGPAKWARLGDLNTATDSDDAQTVIARIAERYDHPGYDAIKLYNDIALYKLERDVQLNHYLRPVCLDVGDRSDKSAIATGWGHTEWGGRGSATLKKVSLNIVSTSRCNETYASSIGRQLPEGIVGSSMMCAGDEQGKDTCQGDSGGPLQVALSEPYCMFSQIGITSFGRACGSNIPGVYTRVSNYISWIEKIVWP
uniref:Putative trypsin-like serine protease n=1 Tax=Panstrongylus lignarius TaxID=156445 RepID=A0A224XHV2_9HEMI